MTVIRPSYADVVRRLVRRLRAEPSPSLPADRRRLVAAVEQALHARARRQARARRGLAVFASAAAALALFAGVRLARHAGSEVGDATAGRRDAHALTVLAASADGAGEVIVGGHAPLPLRRGMALGAGLRLVAPPAGEVRVGTDEGTSLTLEPRGDLTVTEASATQRFALHAGAVRAHVSRLFAGERFIIDTTDAKIEVHGTAFRVAVVPADAACASTTRVTVSEGVVSVNAGGRETLVSPGERWPAECDRSAAHAADGPRRIGSNAVARAEEPRPRERRHEAAASPHERPAPAPAEPVAAAPPVAPATPVSVAAPAPSSSELAAQNDLFAAALRAKKEGQLADAARLLAKLADEHPRGPLVESALVQRMKILAIIDPTAGARAATDYLARFPGGFARPEAQRLADRAAP